MSSLHAPLLPKSSPSPQDVKTKARQTAIAFAAFVVVRSFHPIIIDMSKTDGKLPYGKATPCVINSAADILIGNGLAFLLGGMKGLKQCWEPEPLKIFGTIAIAYAFGDFLEMASMSVMGGAVYQILLQSKLIITALIIWYVKGQPQTNLQWNVLLTIVVAMSAFVLVGEGSSAGGSFQALGLAFVLVKVVFSCGCAVLTEKYLKQYGHIPIYCQVAMLKSVWFIVTVAMSYGFDADVRKNGFFSGWDGRTVLVACSWICKGWTTFLMLKSLDSVLKNIGEAVAILVIYVFDVFVADAVSGFLPVAGKAFHLSSFLMVMVVVLTVVTYTMAPNAPANPSPAHAKEYKK